MEEKKIKDGGKERGKDERRRNKGGGIKEESRMTGVKIRR
jgi:hypothetical protein